MKLLDRYIIKKLILTFLFITIATITTISLVDFVNNNEDYLQNNAPYKAIAQYYLLFMFFTANILTPIAIFMSTIFVTSRLASYTEIIAALSNGINLKRLSLPYIVNGLIIAALSFLLVGWLLPISSKKRIPFEVEYRYRDEAINQKNVHLKIAPNQYAYVKYYNYYYNRGDDFTLEEIEGKNLKSKLHAKRIIWNEKTQEWKLFRWTKKIIEHDHEEVTSGDMLKMKINLLPKDLTKSPSLKEILTITELENYIIELKEKGSDELRLFVVEKYVRYMYPFTAIFLSLFGFMLAYRKSRSGAIKTIAIGLVLALIYIGFFISCRGIAETSTTHPLIILSIPNLAFISIGMFMNKYFYELS
jgi:lipopolysaccharide export system permease protein